MKRIVFIIFLFIFCLSFNTPLMSAENDSSGALPKEETLQQETEPNTYRQYQKAKEELWKDYVKLRDELINGDLSRKLQITYEEFMQRKEALRNMYIEGRKKLLDKYFSNKEKQN